MNRESIEAILIIEDNGGDTFFYSINDGDSANRLDLCRPRGGRYQHTHKLRGFSISSRWPSEFRRQCAGACRFYGRQLKLEQRNIGGSRG